MHAMTTVGDVLVERMWRGEATMEEWTASVAGGKTREIAPGIVVVSTGYLYGNVTAIRTAEGLVLVDTGSRETAHETLAAIRRFDDSPVHTVIYTHGHVDHTWGALLIDEEAEARGRPLPRVIAHRNVLKRFRRYDETHGLNSVVMGRQFSKPDYVFPDDHRRPDEVYDTECSFEVGGVRLELIHGRGETDDATFVWLPQTRVLLSGDFVIWVFPNAGNPRKVQRYAPDWAAALRYMQTLIPDVLVPGHGPVVTGTVRAHQMLEDGANVLESLVRQTRDLMNQGCSLDQILHQVRAPEELLAKPYLLPKYDDPEFVVRGIWHLYAGWYGGNPATLKPAREVELAREIAALAGGPRVLAGRAEELFEAGQLRLASHLIELAVAASPDDRDLHRLRARIYARRVDAETSLIGKAIFAVAQRDSQAPSAA